MVSASQDLSLQNSNDGPPKVVSNKDAKAWQSTTLDLLVLMVISTVATLILIRDPALRICDTIGDDFFVAHCNFFLHPEHFDKDIEFQAWARVALSSMLNWLPAIICKFAQIKPAVLYTPLVVLQNSLIVGSTYLLGRTMTAAAKESRIISILAAVFTMLWKPQWWNSALMCSFDWFPYSNWVALPFLLLGFNFAILGKKWTANILIIVGALIHPILACLASLMIGVYRVLASTKQTRTRAIIESGLTTGLTAALAFVPIKLSTAGIEFAQDTDRLKVLAMNIHATPWGNGYPYGISSFTASLIFAALLSLIALLGCPGKEKGNKGQLFFLSVFITTVLTTAAHCLAAVLHIAAIQNLIISRSTMLLLTTCIPLVMWQLWSILINGSIVSALTVLTFLFCANPFTLMAAALSAVSQWINESKSRFGLSLILQGLGAVIAAIMLCYHTPQFQEPVKHQFLEPLFGIMLPQMISQNRNLVFDWKLFMSALAVLIVVRVLLDGGIQWRNFVTATKPTDGKKNQTGYQSLLCLTLVVSLTVAACIENRKQAKSSIQNIKTYYEVQKWARDNTPPGSSFILVNPTLHPSWRGVTERQTIATSQLLQVYCSMQPLVDYNRKLAKFYSAHPPLILKGSGNEQDMTTENWSLFANEFGGDYLVRRKDWPKLGLPLVFENSEFVIHRL